MKSKTELLVEWLYHMSKGHYSDYTISYELCQFMKEYTLDEKIDMAADTIVQLIKKNNELKESLAVCLNNIDTISFENIKLKRKNIEKLIF